MLDMAILGLLEERDLHGYEIRRQLREHLGLLANVSFGSIYPALTRLEKSGAVVANGTDTPVEDVDPIQCYYAAVSRRLAEPKVDEYIRDVYPPPVGE